MKFTKLFAAVLCIATVATACEQPFEEPAAQGKVINLAIDVDNFTKATDTAFEEGDQIGLHIVPGAVHLNNAKYTYTEGALVGEQTNYWYLDESKEADVYAYYPYSESGNYKAAGYTFTVNADQSKERGLTTSDLMVAKTASKPTKEAIELNFQHVLSKIIINVDNQLEEEIEDIYFSDVYGSVTVNFESGDIATTGKQGTIKTAKVTTAEGATAYVLIVAPQENVSPKLIVKTATQQYTYQLRGNISFTSGKVSTAPITISDDSIATAFTPTITDWVGDNELQFGQGEGFEGGDNTGGNTGGGDSTNGVVYLHPGIWNVDDAWFSAHVWGDGDQDITLTDNDGDGVYECTVSAASTSIIFCRMNPAYTDFGWNDDTMTDENKRVWNQTGNLTIGVAPNNHFYVTSWEGGEWRDANGGGNTGDGGNTGTASGLGVAGSFATSGWNNDALLYSTTTAGVFVAKGIEFKAYDAFKIRTAGTWEGEVNLGAGDINYIQANKYITAVAGSVNNITVEAAGTYDIYFDQNTTKVYLMAAGVDYTTATEQTTNGNAPDPSTMSWGLVGAHNDWGSGDIALTWDGTCSMYVAKGATLGSEFKVRADESWSTNFGSNGPVVVDQAGATTLYNDGGNCSITAGTYDVYFWYDTKNLKANAKLWVKSVGAAAPKL
ncbi:MAG: fimbrillin family protein [Tidjanibacter sp.]|nr:fimbrillin family protein [Tidjanibacter sp.]